MLSISSRYTDDCIECINNICLKLRVFVYFRRRDVNLRAHDLPTQTNQIGILWDFCDRLFHYNFAWQLVCAVKIVSHVQDINQQIEIKLVTNQSEN